MIAFLMNLRTRAPGRRVKLGANSRKQESALELRSSSKPRVQLNIPRSLKPPESSQFCVGLWPGQWFQKVQKTLDVT